MLLWAAFALAVTASSGDSTGNVSAKESSVRTNTTVAKTTTSLTSSTSTTSTTSTTSKTSTTSTTSTTTTSTTTGLHLANGGIDQACRGANASDDDDDYYDFHTGVKSLAECEAIAAKTPHCKGLEFSEEWARCEVWTHEIQASASAPGFVCIPVGDLVKAVQLAKAPEDRPACQRQAILPVAGRVHKVTVDGKKAWDLQLQAGCGMALREPAQMLRCLKDSWLVLTGTSQATVMITQLINFLAPGSLHPGVGPGKDGYNSDGIYTEVIDVIIEDGKVVHKKVWHEKKIMYDYHSPEHDKVLQSRAFSTIHEAPDGRPGSVRVTLMLAEYWDEATRAVKTIESVKGYWQQAKVFFLADVAQWYRNGGWCHMAWCGTRTSLLHLPQSEVVNVVRRDLEKAFEVFKPFCSKGGMAEHHGCTLMGLNSCSHQFSNWQNDDFVQLVSKHATPTLRLLDLWKLGEGIPDVCTEGHSSPAAASLIWQVIMSSVCDPKDSAPGRLASWEGDACFDYQIHAVCPGRSCGGMAYTWDWALSQPCKFAPLMSSVGKEKATLIVKDEEIPHVVAKLGGVNWSPGLLLVAAASLTVLSVFRRKVRERTHLGSRELTDVILPEESEALTA